MKRKPPPKDSCQRVDEGNGWSMCHRCTAFWYSRPQPAWRPSDCLQPHVFYDTEYHPAPCESCGQVNDMAAALNAKPKPGDFTICVYCGHIAVFDFVDCKLTTREPNGHEIIAMAGNPQIPFLQQIRWLAINAATGKKAK